MSEEEAVVLGSTIGPGHLKYVTVKSFQIVEREHKRSNRLAWGLWSIVKNEKGETVVRREGCGYVENTGGGRAAIQRQKNNGEENKNTADERKRERERPPYPRMLIPSCYDNGCWGWNQCYGGQNWAKSQGQCVQYPTFLSQPAHFLLCSSIRELKQFRQSNWMNNHCIMNAFCLASRVKKTEKS